MNIRPDLEAVLQSGALERECHLFHHANVPILSHCKQQCFRTNHAQASSVMCR